MSAINTKIAKEKMRSRNERTRTLIQLGGIVSLSGLVHLFEIEEGEDLQFDENSKNKAAILLGALSGFSSSVDLSSDLKEAYLKKGIQIMKTRDYQKKS